MITNPQIPNSKSIYTYHKKYGKSNKCLIMVYMGTLLMRVCVCMCAGGKYNASQHATDTTTSCS